MKPTPTRIIEKRSFAAVLALCALTAAAYSSSFQAGFAWDNRYLILQDPRIRAATAENLAGIFQHTYWWPTGEAGLYRPLATLSYLFNYAVLGSAEQPAGYHWTNLVLHMANVLLVWVLMRRLMRQLWPAFFVAALWGVHPATTESVTNIVGRPDLLAAMGTLGGFLCYLKGADATRWRKASWLVGVAVATAVGVLSKESGVIVVAVIAIYELVVGSRDESSGRKRTRQAAPPAPPMQLALQQGGSFSFPISQKLPWWRRRCRLRGLTFAQLPSHGRSLILGCAAALPAIVAMLMMRASALRAAAPAEFPFTDNPTAGASFWIGRLTAVKVIARCLELAIWPARLSVDYSYSEIPLARGTAQDWLAWLVVAAAVAGVAMLYRRNRTAFFFAGFAFLTFLPMSNLLFPIGTIMADRFLYLPCVGLLACVVMAVGTTGPRAAVAGCLIAAALAGRTWVRNLDWKDDLTLASAGVLASPDSYKVHKVLASALYAAAPDSNRVAQEADRALAILDPLPDALNDADAYRWSGGFYLAKGDYPRALQILQRCVRICAAYDRQRPSHTVASAEPEAYRLLAAASLHLGDVTSAADAANRARDLDPLNPDVYRQSAEVLSAKGDGEGAAVLLTEGIFLTADTGLRMHLVDLYRSGVDAKGCAIRIGPRGAEIDPECATVHRHICAAAVEVIGVRRRKGQEDLARSQTRIFIANFGCPAGPLEHVMPD